MYKTHWYGTDLDYYITDCMSCNLCCTAIFGKLLTLYSLRNFITREQQYYVDPTNNIICGLMLFQWDFRLENIHLNVHLFHVSINNTYTFFYEIILQVGYSISIKKIILPDIHWFLRCCSTCVRENLFPFDVHDRGSNIKLWR